MHSGWGQFLYSNPNINYRRGYYNEDRELAIPEMNFELPWYMCSYGNITVKALLVQD